MKLAKIAFAALPLLAPCFAAADEQEFAPRDPVVGENFSNPLGYDLSGLNFSWKIPPLREGIKQTAYRIVTAHSEEGLKDKHTWDTGRVESSQNRNIPYGGESVKSRQRIWWKVLFWDENGVASEWSKPQWFEAGLLSNLEWGAKWISSADAPVEISKDYSYGGGKHAGQIKRKFVPPAYVRKTFHSQKNVKFARAYVASHGWFQAYINGKKLGDDYLGTGWTAYEKHTQGQTYDITGLIRQGENAFGAVLTDGWYSGYLMSNPNAYGVKPELLARIEITYEDGSVLSVSSDETWKYSGGPVVFADIYDGEVYDARLEMPGWNDAGFDDSSWKRVAAAPIRDSERVLPRRDRPVRKMMTLKPLSVKQTSPGTFLFDMGQNMVGWAKIRVPSAPDRKIVLRFGEMLNKDGSLYNDNYRTAKSQDVYIGAGSGVAEWEPNFTFHGFRYVEISGLPADARLGPDAVEGVVLHTDMALTGNFVCSHPKVNALQSNIQWGQRGNFLSVPTDCPQRDERLGWTGDAQVFCSTAAFNMDVSAFFSKWLLDVRNSQTPDGFVPDWAPRHQRAAPGTWGANPHAAWGDAGVIVPWRMWLAYGDKKFLAESFESMKRHLDFIDKNFKTRYSKTGYGDWLCPGGAKTEQALIAAAYAVRGADIAAKAAEVLGDGAARKKYLDMAARYRKLFAERYLSADGTVKGDTQTGYLCALAFDVLDADMRPKAFEKLLKAVERADYHLCTGFVGTPLLLKTLSRFGRDDVAMKVFFKQTYPSWLFSVEQGATTIWERWNSYTAKDGFGDVKMNSFNHYAYGSVGEWMYEKLAGLAMDESAPGWRNIIFAPAKPEGLTFASATYETPYGPAKSSWRLSDGVMEWNIEIPPNATGRIVFPTDNLRSIRLNGNTVDASKFSDFGGRPSLEGVSSGRHNILLKFK